MAGLTWFELDVDMPDDPKCSGLAARLHNPLAFAFPVRLYAYCYRHATDRFSGPGAIATIEETACRWTGKTGALFTALEAEGFIDREGEILVIHGVKERLGPHIQKLERDRERARERRDALARSYGRRADVAETSPGCSPDVAGDRNSNSNQNQIPTAAGDAERRMAQFRRALGDMLAKPPDWFRLASPDKVAATRSALDAEFVRLGVERAAEVVAECARRDGKVKQWLSYYLGPLSDAMRDPLPAAAPEQPLPAPDPSWLDAHPGSRERWEAYLHEVVTKSTSQAERARQAEAAIWMLKGEFPEVRDGSG